MPRIADALARAKHESSDPAAPSLPDWGPRPGEMGTFAGEDGRVATEWIAPRLGEPAPVASDVKPDPAPVVEERPFEREAPDAPRSPSILELDGQPAAGGRRRTWVVMAAVLVVAAAAAFVYARGGSRTVEYPVAVGTLQEIVAGKGKVEPPAEVRVSAKMLGRLKAVYVREGDRVTAGDLLAAMDDEEARAQLARARAALEQARARRNEVQAGPRAQEVEAMRADLNEAEARRSEAAAASARQQRLFEQGYVSAAQADEYRSRSEVAAAQYQSASERLSLLLAGARPETRAAADADVQRAEAEYREAEASMANSRVLAPISGSVLHRYMEPGEVIVLQRPQPILTLADVSRTLVRTEIDETDLRKVRVGQPATVRSDAYPGRTFAGRVTEVGRSAGRRSISSEDPAVMLDARVVEAVVELEPGAPLQFGLTVDVEITTEERRGVLVVPVEALVRRGDDVFVRVREGGREAERHVRVGLDDGRHAEIVSGLQAGTIVLAGATR